MAQRDAHANILELLKGGDRRSLRGVNAALALAAENPELFAELLQGMWHQDRLVRMRAADAAEKFCRTNYKMLQPYKKELLGLLHEADAPELRWHLAAMIPRLALNSKERRIAYSSLKTYLEDRSSIVKAFALQSLADLAKNDKRLGAGVLELLRSSARTGTPAMKARSRKLLLQFEEA